MHKLVQPKININGSDGMELLENIVQLQDALSDAVGLWQKFAPHGRDYQTLPDGTYGQAREAWAERGEFLLGLFGELEEYAQELNDQLLLNTPADLEAEEKRKVDDKIAQVEEVSPALASWMRGLHENGCTWVDIQAEFKKLESLL